MRNREELLRLFEQFVEIQGLAKSRASDLLRLSTPRHTYYGCSAINVSDEVIEVLFVDNYDSADRTWETIGIDNLLLTDAEWEEKISLLKKKQEDKLAEKLKAKVESERKEKEKQFEKLKKELGK